MGPLMSFRKLFVIAAAVTAMGVAAGAALAQVTDAQKAQVDAAKAQGSVGEQADGFLACRTACSGEVQAAVEAINAGRRAEYGRIGAPDNLAPEVVGARNFERFILPRVRSGQWYRNAQGAWVQKP